MRFSPHFMGFCFLFVFPMCLFILFSAQPPFAETVCYMLPKNWSKQVTRGKRDLFCFELFSSGPLVDISNMKF